MRKFLLGFVVGMLTLAAGHLRRPGSDGCRRTRTPPPRTLKRSSRIWRSIGRQRGTHRIL